VVAVFGSTEAEPIAHVACREISADDWEAMGGGKGLLAGVTVPEIQMRIVPDQWGSTIKDFREMPSGEPGEILVTGEHVLKGYLHGEGDEETKVRIEGEIWHRTGDAGYRDTEGRLWLLGRCAACVRDARGILYPFAVECVAMSFESIRRAAFVLLDGKRVLVVEGEIAEAELDELRAKVTWASIDEVRRLRRIPVDARHNAKVNYPELRRIVGRARVSR
jgi:acyl-CoA synthetase (AMP-forming)/AMP-acid ligase II